MHDKEKFEGLKERLIYDNELKYGQEIREKYGDEAVEASNANLLKMSQEDYQAMTQCMCSMSDLSLTMTGG